jgi:hypothetical protein
MSSPGTSKAPSTWTMMVAYSVKGFLDIKTDQLETTISLLCILNKVCGKGEGSWMPLPAMKPCW